MDSDSAENQVSNDGVKEILAPAEGPRENLINTAVKFLQNPKVMSSPLYQKKAFLQKKGLTQVEIDLAVQRAGVVETSSVPPNNTVNQPVGLPSQSGPPHLYQAAMVQPIPPQSAWARARDLTMTTVVVASVSYAVYQLFQKYLRPLLLGKTEQEKRLELIEQEIKVVQSMKDSLDQMASTLTSIQASLSEQQHQNVTSHAELQGISDLKADIASLKGLMLNKNQFPALPTTTPILPAWQRAPAPTANNASSQPPLSSSSSSKDIASPSTTATEAETNHVQIEKPLENVNESGSEMFDGLEEDKKEALSESFEATHQIKQEQ